MNTLTIFTPTYNRAHLLPRLYHSLLRQSSQQFDWLVVDDGSQDNTEALVRQWQQEQKLTITYIYKENGGLHTGYNTAIANVSTELCMCIDSDDFPPDYAVGHILAHWAKYGSEKYAGIVGQDFYMSGESVGGELPNVKSLHFMELKYKYNYRGDVKIIHRTELLKKYAPMPTFVGEKNFNPSYMFVQVDQHHPLLVLNENLCFVDYQPDGMSINTMQQYRNSPNSFVQFRRLYMSLNRTPPMFIFRNAIHYISSCIFAKESRWFSASPRKGYTLAAIPFGIVLNVYIRIKTKA